MINVLEEIGTLKFRYVSELPSTGDTNVIYATSQQKEYIFIDGRWELIGSVETQGTIIEPIEHKTYPTNCKNCGAVLKNGICEYCGTDMRGEI